MRAEKIDIERFMFLSKELPLIDVRSPSEYKHAHIPGAHLIPLFSDDERKVVGTAYKQESRELAIKLGLDFFGPKMRKIVERADALVNREESKSILVYCWRGGMRSGAIAWLLDLYGFKVYTLAGGYKQFRRYVLDTFRLPFQFNVLGGYTGSGKTALLKTLQEKGQTIIDLEAIAKHKGSAFGNIGMPDQPSQEMFENLLATELRKSIVNSGGSDSPFTIHYSPVWLEDESQRIGLVNLPNDFWKTLRLSPLWFLDIPFEERLRNIVAEYGGLDQERMINAINRISEKLGHLNAKTAILLLKEGKITESFAILLKYYDKFYLRALHNREALNSLLNTIEFKSIIPENADQLIALQQKRSLLQPEEN